MTIKEFYDSVQGNYEDAIARLRDENRILRYLNLFSKDPSAKQLEEAINSENWPEAFRAAHTMKGVVSNLSFTYLYEKAYALTETLRPCLPLNEAGMKLYREVVLCYEATMAGIVALSDEKKA